MFDHDYHFAALMHIKPHASSNTIDQAMIVEEDLVREESGFDKQMSSENNLPQSVEVSIVNNKTKIE